MLGVLTTVLVGYGGRLVQLPKVTGIPAPHPYAISGDGRTVIGQFAPGNPFIWRGGEISRFRPTSDANILDHYAQASSFDGSTIVGKSGGAYRWRRGLPVERIGKGVDAFAYGVNSDGKIVVGQIQTKKGLDGFVWTENAGFTMVAESPFLAVSADGTAACGIRTVKGGVLAFDWHNGLTQLLPMNPTMTDSSAFAISSNGLQIVGYMSNSNTTTACIWENETYRSLSNLGSKEAVAKSITYDGSYVGGYAGETAVVWDALSGKGSRLSDLLKLSGVSVVGWDFESVNGIARVGSNLYVTGWAHFRGKEAGYWATITLSK